MHVLLVEYHNLMARALKRGLEEEGFTVDVACGGPSGTAAAPTAAYDAVVLDLPHPPGAGLALVQGWRRAGLTAPVLVLAPPRGPGDRSHGPEAGGDDWLVKPFALEELLGRVRALARRPDPAPVPAGKV
jgi:two-component system OmpR family response regulator